MPLLRTIFIVAFPALLASCAATSSTSFDKATIYYDRQTYVEASSRDVPAITGDVVQHGRCAVLIGTPAAKIAPQSFCVYSLTKDALYVLKWNAKDAKYEWLTTVSFRDLHQVSLVAFLRTAQVQMTEQTRLIAFSALIDDGGIYDRDATTRIFDLLKAYDVPVSKAERMVAPPAAPAPVIPIFVR